MSGPAALVLAGSRPGRDPLAESEGVPHKALIRIGKRTLLERVIGALREAGLERVIVSCAEGPVAEMGRALGADVAGARAGPSASVAAVLETAGAPLLVTTADHALLKPEWVRQLLDETPDAADVSIMLALRERVEAAVPGSRRTWLRFADGQWSGCNLFLLATPKAARAVEVWSAVEADRKRPWRIAARLGPGTLLSMALGRLTLAEGIARLGRRIGVDAALVSAADGLAAVDVDTADDLARVRALVTPDEE